MPVYKIIRVNEHTKVWVWKITEDLSDLYKDMTLKEVSQNRLNSMKSETHQKGFLSVRKLLEQAGYTDIDLEYTPNGKPMLKDGKHISITHSGLFSALIISDKNTGIDIEKQQAKILQIASKFAEFDQEFIAQINPEQTLRELMAVWGIKEAVYKFHSEKGISIREHIRITALDLDKNKLEARVMYDQIQAQHKAQLDEFEQYTLVYLI